MEKIEILGELIIILESKEDWVNRIPRLLPPKRYNSEKFIWVDSMGHTMAIGQDFSAAEELNSYPVKVYRAERAQWGLEKQKLAKQS